MKYHIIDGTFRRTVCGQLLITRHGSAYRTPTEESVVATPLSWLGEDGVEAVITPGLDVYSKRQYCPACEVVLALDASFNGPVSVATGGTGSSSSPKAKLR